MQSTSRVMTGSPTNAIFNGEVYYESISVDYYEIVSKIKLYREILKTCKNPVMIKITENDLKSWLAIKKLYDDGRKK